MSAAAAPALTSPAPRLLLLGLDSHVASRLVTALPEFQAFVHPNMPSNSSECHTVLDDAQGDLIFCSASSSTLPLLLRAGREKALPVIVVAVDPNEVAWLDAMDAGAADYIAPPFEPQQLRWVVDTNLRLPCAR